MKRKFLSTLALLMSSSVLLIGCSSNDTSTPATENAGATSTPSNTVDSASSDSDSAETDAPTSDTTGNGVSGKVSIAGSTTVASPMEAIQEAFKEVEPNITLEIQAVGSSAGIKAAADGTAEIGMASREVKDSERAEYGLNEIVIAKDAIAVVVHPDNPITDLTIDQVKDLFEGTIKNWSEIGGADQDVIVICREDGSGTRSAFEEIIGLEMDINGVTVSSVSPMAIIQEGTGAVKATTAAQEGGIGFVSLGYIDNTISAVTISGVAPTVEDTLSGAYPISRPLLLVTQDDLSAQAQALVDYILGSDGQAVLESHNYVPVG
ncbi:MAG: hypothetical protein BEN18_09370 [Epulopiscium sp. Nuni2H_MBin001]|nr:MAG: hypothetical protein BEN18_09370 [Epulopiscium sp. Nuni2H_MBin001]